MVNGLVSQCLSYSGKIQSALSSGDWEALNKLLEDRQLDLEKLVSLMTAEDKAPQLKELILSIQEADKYFVQVLKEKKQDIESQIFSLKKGRKSIKAYQL
ncbi:flagellar protein FliT [uncultured Paraglaciecola sp.]|uniref:flagellar protein FliT n=1 Tax=uncultured Paraglaciecola sp. TaxID=1765024 RepID=UPI0025DFEDC6|nr:flagellar protein FliT [uncultured Paraglaciecola sp.]